MYNTLAQAYLNTEFYDKVISTFEAAKLAVVMKELSFYKDVLRACVHLKDATNAKEAVSEATKNGVALDLELFELLQKVYLAAGKVKEATEVFDDMKKAGLEPTKEMVQFYIEMSNAKVGKDKIKEQFSYRIFLLRVAFIGSSYLKLITQINSRMTAITI
jgi:pentatricopeptide repeat protein